MNEMLKSTTNDKELGIIFKKYKINIPRKEIFKNIQGLTTHLNGSKRDTIVFYRILTENGFDLFKKRLESSSSQMIIVSGLEKIKSENIFYISNDHFFELQSDLVDLFYPVKKSVKICGITGTNGKTTVVHLSREISYLMGKKVISIGTLGVIGSEGDLLEKLSATTPSFIDIHRILFQYQDSCDGFFLEVSSHGLEQDRFKGLQFNVSGWTSFSQDHLDYHTSMEEYFMAKKKITKYLRKGGPLFIPMAEKELSLKLSESVFLKEARDLSDWGLSAVNPLFISSFNKSNLELAMECVNTLWKTPRNINLSKILPPRGRYSLIQLDNQKVIIDYAHTPDALENILKAIRKEYEKSFIITVFGCGGDRDHLKRPMMGAIAGKYSDYCFVTSDNPRNERPEDIINQVVEGMKLQFEIIVDREKSIIAALLKKVEKEKIILIAGKGHEEYQELNDKKVYFSDFEVVYNNGKR